MNKLKYFIFNKMTETSIEKIISSGNTIAEQTQRTKNFKLSARNLMITVNHASFEKLEDIITYLQHFKSNNYILVCSHNKPDLHYHIYAQYTNTLKFDSRYLYGAHIEKAMGSSQQCMDYCKGLDEKHIALNITCTVIHEQGTPKEKGGRRIKDIMKMSDEEIMELDANLYNSAMKIRACRKIKVGEWHKDIKVYYIWGPSEAGKSKKAEEIVKENGFTEFTEVKHIGQFWHGIYDSEITGAAIYDDFRDSHMTASEFINFIDYNIHTLNFKGGSAKNMLKLIIITSVQNPQEIYKNMKDEPRKQWTRRLNIIKLGDITKMYNNHNQIRNHDVLSYESKLFHDIDNYESVWDSDSEWLEVNKF